MKESKTYDEAFKRRVVSKILNDRLTKEQARLRYEIGGNSTTLDWMH